jgi:hypothetical protein
MAAADSIFTKSAMNDTLALSNLRGRGLTRGTISHFFAVICGLHDVEFSTG